MMKGPIDPVTLATPFFIATVILEIVLARFGKLKARYETSDTAVSLVMGLISSAAGLLTAGASFAAAVWIYQHRLFTIPMTAIWAWVLVFLLEDLTYYWFHRLSHERRIWWAAHVNHHSSQHYNLSTALRQTWTGGVAGTWALWLPLSLLGFPPAMVAIQKGVSLVYQYWIHTEAIRRLPRPIEAVFNTPSHHRVHHGANREYLDKNYAGIFIVWDRLFRTFEPERAPVVYGLTKNISSFNPFVIAFHEYGAIAHDIAATRSWRDRFGIVYHGPAWRRPQRD